RFYWLGDFFFYYFLEFFYRNLCISFTVLSLDTKRNRVGFLFFFTYNKHKRNFLQFGFSDFLTDSLISVVNQGANFVIFQQTQNFFCIIFVFLTQRQDYSLCRHEP